MLRDIAAEGRTVLLCSHRLEELERTADDVAVLVGGHVVFTGAMASLRNEGMTVATQLEQMLGRDAMPDEDDD